MKRNKIAMLLAMALTVTQSVAVPVAAEELTADASQEVEMAQDDADAEVAVEADEDASEEAGAEIQDDAEELQDEDFAAEEDLSDGTVQETFSDDAGDAGEKKYEFYYDFGEGHIGNEAMLPNSEMRIQTHLMDATDDNNWNDISSYELKLQPSTGSEDYTGIADVSLDGTDIVIKSHSKTGFFAISAKVLVDGAEVYTGTVYFEINEYVIMPESVTDANGNKLNPQVGEVIDYAKKGVALYHYVNGNLTGVGDPETLKIETVYDENDWSVQYTEGWDVPTMTRKTKDATWIFFKAWEKKLETGRWEIIDTKRYDFDATDKVHSHSWITKNVIKKATCTAAGSKVENCASCDATRTVTIPAKGHTVVKDVAVAPTVFADGKTEGSHCSVCGTVLEKQNTIAKVPGTIYLTASSLKMKTGQSTTAFKATGFSEGDYVTAVTSNKPRTVKVTNVNKNGTFKLTAGKKKGSAVVTVTLASKKTASFKVTVQKAAVKTTKITTTTKSLTLAKGATYKKLASSIAVTPVTSKEKVTYSSSNKKVATVSSKGVIKAKKAGTAKITVKSGSKKVVVTVKVTGVKTTKLSGVPATKKIAKGKSFKIKAAATPKNTDEKITFKSSNKKVATVTSKGVVKGLKKGTATITVQSGSKKMTCKVTVK